VLAIFPHNMGMEALPVESQDGKGPRVGRHQLCERSATRARGVRRDRLRGGPSGRTVRAAPKQQSDAALR
jgi:hypothetical protein